MVLKLITYKILNLKSSKYSPLDVLCMSVFLTINILLKSLINKNVEGTLFVSEAIHNLYLFPGWCLQTITVLPTLS